MTIQTRTWPYGTTKKVVVAGVSIADDLQIITCVCEADHEGFMLFSNVWIDGVKNNDIGTITFTEGGPTGGYWKFRKDN